MKYKNIILNKDYKKEKLTNFIKKFLKLKKENEIHIFIRKKKF